jgi:aldehyde dehydrogenase (NAD+)
VAGIPEEHGNQLYIGGRWVRAASAERIEVTSPLTERVIGSVPAPTEGEADAAVAAARASFNAGDWRRTPVKERIDVLLRLADRYQAATELMGQTLTAEMGAPIRWTTASQAGGSVAIIRAMADEARRFPWEEERLSGPVAGTVLREPAGVVVAIPPWNVAQSTTLSKLVPALLAGCSVVVKPSPETPLDALLLARLIDGIGLPDGVVSILPAGREIGRRLVANPAVDHVAFTGSTAAGRAIAAVCGAALRRCTLELGGKSAAIVCDDADLDQVLAGLRTASFNVSGQACIAQTRILAPRARYAEVTDALAGLARGLRLGDPSDPATDLGPLVTRAHRDRVLSYIDAGAREGARLVTGGQPGSDRDGGRRPGGQATGWFVEPTVFADVSSDMRIAREEIFGPVLSVIPYDGDEEAVAIANDSDYGLAGSVWSADLARAEAIARQVRTGMIGVNGFRPDFSMPFGGFKASGIGREFGREGLETYTEAKALYRPVPA